MQATIGIVGNGFVGNAVAKGFQDKVNEIRIYDIDEDKSTHGYLETLISDYIFVCLPTPMKHEEGAECNISIVDNFFEELPSTIEGIIIIKSTVPIGTTERLTQKYPHLKIVHNPEFLTAANAEDDFVNADRHIVGGDEILIDWVGRMYKACFPSVPVFLMDSKESEAVKYFANSFLATKVMVFNEMKSLCDQIEGIDYDTVISGVVADSRIGNSHTSVPGPDGEYGFGGTCFPKDINALIHTMRENDVDPLVLDAVWKQNKNYRGLWDWSENISAVMNESELA